MSLRKSASSGNTQSPGCCPSIAVTTEEFERAGERTKSGENHIGSRAGGAIAASASRAGSLSGAGASRPSTVPP